MWNKIEALSKRYPQVRVLQHQIMPDHVHLVPYVTERLPEGLPLGNIIASWKAACSKACAALRDLKAATHNYPTQEELPASTAPGSSSEAAFRSPTAPAQPTAAARPATPPLF